MHNIQPNDEQNENNKNHKRAKQEVNLRRKSN